MKEDDYFPSNVLDVMFNLSIKARNDEMATNISNLRFVKDVGKKNRMIGYYIAKGDTKGIWSDESMLALIDKDHSLWKERNKHG